MRPGNDATGDIETQSRPFAYLFGREEGVENALMDLCRDPWSIITDLDTDSRPVMRGADGDRPRSLKRIQRIVQEIHPDLVELSTVGMQNRKLRVILALNPNIPHLVVQQGQGDLDPFMEIDLLNWCLIHVGEGFDRVNKI
jgi:hypothetical protein